MAWRCRFLTARRNQRDRVIAAERLSEELHPTHWLISTGLFGFLSESKVPGSVPALGSIVLPYDGDYMAPLEPLHFLN